MNKANFTDVLDYIDWNELAKDYNLKTGDISVEQCVELEDLLKAFVLQNNGYNG
jgi:hypothetical protein|tara:strand:+ start:287 stop:448 length:162 start_codon:yes stop_codon:yes gene_type:complete